MDFLIKNIKVEQLQHNNQYVIRHARGITFQSYDSNIATISLKGSLSLGKEWSHSKTTLKHLYIFLNKYYELLNPILQQAFNYNNFKTKANKKAYIQKLIDNKIIDMY